MKRKQPERICVVDPRTKKRECFVPSKLSRLGKLGKVKSKPKRRSSCGCGG